MYHPPSVSETVAPAAAVPAPLRERARAAADLLRDHADRTVTVVHHIDADGVSSGAVALEALERAGIPHDSIAVRSMDDVHQARVRDADADLLWFCDLGSTVHMEFPQVPKVVCDHHELVRDGSEEFPGHVNPLLDHLPGDSVSGAGTAYLVAHALDPANQDLLPLALVGASADLQDRIRHSEAKADPRWSGEAASDREHPSGAETGPAMHGANAALVAQGEAAGLVEARTDLGFYGPETRPLGKFLGYARETPVPGVTGHRRDAERFLRELGIPEPERSWNALAEPERVTVRSALVERLLDCGLDLDLLWRQVLTFPCEPAGTPLREPQEYGTLLNATARYDRPAVGLAVARGDRGDGLEAAMDLLGGHRKHLVGALDAFARHGVTETPSLQWVHLRDEVRDTVVGIVCGMALGSLDLRQDRPLLGFAHTPDGRTKVSSRAPSLAAAAGIDLAQAMREGAEAVGGQGGGHKGAAGATIPRGTEEEFLAAVEAVLSGQSPESTVASP